MIIRHKQKITKKAPQNQSQSHKVISQNLQLTLSAKHVISRLKVLNKQNVCVQSYLHANAIP